MFRLAALPLLASTTAALAQEPAAATEGASLEEVMSDLSVLVCSIGGSVELIALRPDGPGKLAGIGALSDAQVVIDGDVLTIIEGADVLTINGGPATRITQGVVTQGQCEVATDQTRAVLDAALAISGSGEINEAGAGIMEQLAAARTMVDLLEAELDSTKAQLADETARAMLMQEVGQEASRRREAAEERASTLQASLTSVQGTINRLEEQADGLRDQYRWAVETIEEAEPDMRCAEAVRTALKSDLFIGELTQIERQAVHLMADACGVVLAPP